ncbi:hypothetical protein BDV93DRAFT_583858 [Ceratobasidium sp. AG-I]|nr:hypothetical protein BDV93DRAFT_583858 [Ceratobasidium sp. AG-I]
MLSLPALGALRQQLLRCYINPLGVLYEHELDQQGIVCGDSGRIRAEVQRMAIFEFVDAHMVNYFAYPYFAFSYSREDIPPPNNGIRLGKTCLQIRREARLRDDYVRYYDPRHTKPTKTLVNTFPERGQRIVIGICNTNRNSAPCQNSPIPNPSSTPTPATPISTRSHPYISPTQFAFLVSPTPALTSFLQRSLVASNPAVATASRLCEE